LYIKVWQRLSKNLKICAPSENKAKNAGELASTVILGYNDHGYNEFTIITNKIMSHFWSQMTGYNNSFHGYNKSRLWRNIFWWSPSVRYNRVLDCTVKFTKTIWPVQKVRSFLRHEFYLSILWNGLVFEMRTKEQQFLQKKLIYDANVISKTPIYFLIWFFL